MSGETKSTANGLSWVRLILGWVFICSAGIGLFDVGLAGWALSRMKGGLMANGGQPLEFVMGGVFGCMIAFFLGSWLKQMKPKVELAPTTAMQRVCCVIGGILIAGGTVAEFIALPATYALAHKKGGISAAPSNALMGIIILGIGGVVGWVVGVLLLKTAEKKSTGEEIVQTGEPMPVSVVAAKVARRSKKRYQSCNVLQVGADSRHLWSFGAGRGGFNLGQDQLVPSGAALPGNLVGRDWKVLFQPKLNVAWLPLEQVFLRVAQLPVGEFEETLAMVELQLEKLSPLPVTQIVWSVEILPQHVDNLQTVIVIIMARDLVEKILGDLEGQGYLADRLELPILGQMQIETAKADGAYIYADDTPGKFSALVAWWHGGTLRSLGLVHVPAVEHRDGILREQLTQMAWSGELEGWLLAAPRWYLVADEKTAAEWQPMFRPWLGYDVEVIAPVTGAQLATLSANRAARAEAGAGIMPPEYALRYRQEFVDRLWMRGLGTVLAVYVAAVMVYLAGSQVQGIRADTKMAGVASLSRSYTNVLQLKAKLEILQNRQALKFASLDCWQKTAELLPVGVSVGSLEFKDGKHFSLSGTAPGDASPELTDFNEGLRKATLPNGEPMFETLSLPQIKLNPGGSSLSWSFAGDLAHAEEMK